MTIQELYQKHKHFYQTLELTFADLGWETFEWECLHLRYLLFYLYRYDIQHTDFFTYHHYKISYYLYILEWSKKDPFVL